MTHAAINLIPPLPFLAYAKVLLLSNNINKVEGFDSSEFVFRGSEALTHYSVVLLFYTPWKHLMFWRGIDKQNWTVTG